jgi:hypothetical protein
VFEHRNASNIPGQGASGRLRPLRTAVPDQLEAVFSDQQWVFGDE